MGWDIYTIYYNGCIYSDEEVDLLCDVIESDCSVACHGLPWWEHEMALDWNPANVFWWHSSDFSECTQNM